MANSSFLSVRNCAINWNFHHFALVLKNVASADIVWKNIHLIFIMFRDSINSLKWMNSTNSGNDKLRNSENNFNLLMIWDVIAKQLIFQIHL